MNEIMRTLICPYKRYLFVKKAIQKLFHTEIVDRYELRNYRDIKIVSRINKIIDINNINTDKFDIEIAKYLKELYLNHRYDVLGSGWVCASQYSQYNCVVDYECNRQSELLAKLSSDYKQIDWNIDLKTKFKFSKSDIYKDGKIEGVPEHVDVKVCWDLGRLYHLVSLSIFSLITRDRDSILEFKNQVMDFWFNNPIGYGINWCGSMNASIRATNLLIAYDIFKQIDDENVLDSNFDELFTSIIYQHGEFIVNNLEANILSGRNHNHYLSNIVGLLYISAYQNNKSSRKWWVFAKKEFYHEINKQFFDDGCNFEGSTSYHRFSGEMFVYGLAIIKRFEGDIPDTIIDKMSRAAYLSKTIKKSSGKVVQIGDNDSGRFIKFSIQGELLSSIEAENRYCNLKGYTKQYNDSHYFDEEFLNHDTFIACVTGLIDRPEFVDEKNNYPLEHSIIKSIANSDPICEKQTWNQEKCINKPLDFSMLHNAITNKIIFNESFNLSKDGTWIIFDKFGLCCYKSDILELYIYGGRRIKTGISSHIHNDKLHFEFCINGKEYFCDPGTGVYTSDIQCREMFRSYKSHNVPDYGFNIDKEKSVFSIDEKSNCEIIAKDDSSVSLFLSTDSIKHLRKVTIIKNSIVIEDYGSQEFDVNLKETAYFSRGYGKVENRQNNILGFNVVKTK